MQSKKETSNNQKKIKTPPLSRMRRTMRSGICDFWGKNDQCGCHQCFVFHKNIEGPYLCNRNKYFPILMKEKEEKITRWLLLRYIYKGGTK